MLGGFGVQTQACNFPVKHWKMFDQYNLPNQYTYSVHRRKCTSSQEAGRTESGCQQHRFWGTLSFLLQTRLSLCFHTADKEARSRRSLVSIIYSQRPIRKATNLWLFKPKVSQSLHLISHYSEVWGIKVGTWGRSDAYYLAEPFSFGVNTNLKPKQHQFLTGSILVHWLYSMWNDRPVSYLPPLLWRKKKNLFSEAIHWAQFISPLKYSNFTDVKMGRLVFWVDLCT